MKYQILPFLPLIGLSMLLFSCNAAKIMEKNVNRHYTEIPEIKKTNQAGLVNVETSLTKGAHNFKMTSVEKRTEKFLPLIVWWDEHYVVDTKLNNKIPVNQFINSINQYSRNSKVMEKLAGKELVLNIEQLPNAFSVNTKTKAVLLLVSWTKVYLKPDGQDVRISYTLNDKGSPLKQGTVEIKDPNKIYGIRYFQSLKNATDDYLTAYDNYYKNLGKMVLDNILAEL